MPTIFNIAYTLESFQICEVLVINYKLYEEKGLWAIYNSSKTCRLPAFCQQTMAPNINPFLRGEQCTGLRRVYTKQMKKWAWKSITYSMNAELLTNDFLNSKRVLFVFFYIQYKHHFQSHKQI